MKTLILAFVLIIPFTAIAQNWTAEQQEVIKQIKRNCDAWGEAIKQKDLSIYKKECQPMKDFVGWWASEGSLWSDEATERFFDNYSNGIKDFYWENLQPLSVKIYGDVAIVYFYWISNMQTCDGKWVRTEQKRLEIHRKVAGKWRWADAMDTAKTLDEVY